MKIKSIITSVIISLILIILLLLFTNTSEEIDIDFYVKNNTSSNINTDINILYGIENTSHIHNLMSLKQIMNNEEHMNTISIDRDPGDFGVTVQIEGDVSNSFYFSVHLKYQKLMLI